MAKYTITKKYIKTSEQIAGERNWHREENKREKKTEKMGQ
jgi:hypothetical protein